jgi:hypothetical protein
LKMSMIWLMRMGLCASPVNFAKLNAYSTKTICQAGKADMAWLHQKFCAITLIWQLAFLPN